MDGVTMIGRRRRMGFDGWPVALAAGEPNRTPAAPGASELRTLVATKWYYYNDDGNVTRVVTAEGTVLGYPSVHAYSAVRMAYAKNQRAVAYAVGETWKWNSATDPTDYDVTYAFQYLYDGARERYLKRRLDPSNPWSQYTVNGWPGGETWTDYDGDQPYGDFTVNPTTGQVNNGRGYDLAMGSFGRDVNGDPDATTAVYDHRDMIGTLRGTTDSSGAPTPGPVYTAFGEQRTLTQQTPPRYGYAGAHGYQTDGTFPFLHVGHRYYDPASGRFLQRDPIGIRGRMNVYSYAKSAPVSRVDPRGLIDLAKCRGYCTGKYVECFTDDPKNPKHVTLCVGNSNQCFENCELKGTEVDGNHSDDPGDPPYPNPGDPDQWDPWPGVGTGGGDGPSIWCLLLTLAAAYRFYNVPRRKDNCCASSDSERHAVRQSTAHTD